MTQSRLTSQPDIIEQAEALMDTTGEGVVVEGVAELAGWQPEDNAGSESASKDDELESYEPR